MPLTMRTGSSSAMSLSILSGKSIVWSGVYEIKWYLCIPIVLRRKDTKSLRHSKAPAQKKLGLLCEKKEGMSILTHPLFACPKKMYFCTVFWMRFVLNLNFGRGRGLKNIRVKKNWP
jgi:hypothetical protein